MTLEDAKNGLLLYLKNRPDGGSEEELIALGVQRGFEEPLLTVWLGTLLSGMARTRALGMTGADYDDDFVPAASGLGDPVAVRDAIVSTYNFLRLQGHDLDEVRKQNELRVLSGARSVYETRVLNIGQAITWVQANAPAGAATAEGLTGLSGHQINLQNTLNDIIGRMVELS